MQIKINIFIRNELLVLPISYHHILQAMFYKLMSENEDGTELHDEGYKNAKRDYKLFTFGLLKGKYSISGKHICFNGNVSIEFRSVDSDLVMRIATNALRYGIRLGERIFEVVSYEISDTKINSESAIISMESPICVYRTIEKGKTIYYSPRDAEFGELIRDNLIRKYRAAYPNENNSDFFFEIMAQKVAAKDKYITYYKNYIIEAYRGIYLINGNSDYLNFLYQTGLGSKNSQGFGMFEIIR